MEPIKDPWPRVIPALSCLHLLQCTCKLCLVRHMVCEISLLRQECQRGDSEELLNCSTIPGAVCHALDERGLNRGLFLGQLVPTAVAEDAIVTATLDMNTV